MSSLNLMDLKHVKSSEFGKKEQLRCLFCGGPQCSKCSDTAYLGMINPAIDRLHSNWINDSILAMQRPSDSILIEGKVLEKFVANRITAVFNLTEPGEHPYCGSGILTASGFPYSPEKLMAVGIKHFNYSWQDMTVPPISLMMDIVNVACDEIAAGGKIAIHCHAGFGRTGIAAACIMIASDQLESAQVVQFVRKRRPGSIQTAAQEKFVYKFERAFYTMMHVYPMTEPVDGKNEPPADSRRRRSTGGGGGSSLYHKTIAQSIKDQQYTLTAEEKLQDRFRWSHRLVYHSVSSLSKLSVDDFNYATLAITGLTKLVPKSLHGSSYNDMINDTLSMSVSYHSINAAPSPLGEKKPASRFMVASNSLSDCNEESIMHDMKLEINLNKYARLVSVGDIVASALKMDGEASAASPNKMSILPTAKSISRISSDNNSPKGSSASTPKGSVASISGPAVATFGAAAVDADSSDSEGDDMVGLHSPGKGSFLPTMRVNSFKQNSTTDYARSKRVSSNLIGQLLLDWIETRRDSVFDAATLDALRGLWREYSAATALSTPFEKALSIRMDVTSGKESGAPRSPSASAAAASAAAGRAQSTASRASVLYRDIKQLLEASLDRYKLVLLSDIMGMYRNFRAIGRLVNGGEVAPIDCLVGLRLAIACIHGRKQHFALIRHRALNMDVVKVFLLKHTHTDRVIINNITFSRETNYETSRNNMGGELVDNLEMVIDTFEVLLEYNWRYERLHTEKVHWNGTSDVVGVEEKEKEKVIKQHQKQQMADTKSDA